MKYGAYAYTLDAALVLQLKYGYDDAMIVCVSGLKQTGDGTAADAARRPVFSQRHNLLFVPLLLNQKQPLDMHAQD